jgi:Uma2 family endonuclease
MVSTLPVYLPQSFTVTDDQFWELARTNPELRLERTAEGELIVMPSTALSVLSLFLLLTHNDFVGFQAVKSAHP